MARYHANEGLTTLDSVTWAARLVGYVAESSVAEIDGSEQGVDDSDTDAGLRSWNIVATYFLDSAQAPPVAGLVIAAATVRYKDAATDGTYAGSLLITRVSKPYRLNNNVVFDVTFKNKGTLTVTAPIA